MHYSAGAAIYVYADDDAPSHFRVRELHSDAQISTTDLQVMAGTISGTISRNYYAEAVAYAADHADVLFAKWREFNERD